MTVEPEKANAASLDWEYDSEYLSLSFNEGKAVFTGLKKGKTTITIKSGEAGTKTVQVTIKDIDSRLIVGYNKRTAGSYKTIILKDGDEVIWTRSTLLPIRTILLTIPILLSPSDRTSAYPAMLPFPAQMSPSARSSGLWL